MIKSILNIDNYWKIIVYYDIDYDFFNVIRKDLKKNSVSDKVIFEVYYNIVNDIAKAATISIFKNKTSIILFNKHKYYYDYINSIIHEAVHVKQAMLRYYKIDDSGEPPAYTVGYIASQMIKIFHLYKC